MLNGEPRGLFGAVQVDLVGGHTVDTRTWLFLPDRRLSRVYPYGGSFEGWRCSGDTCGGFAIEAGTLDLRWDDGRVDSFAYEHRAEGFVLDGTFFRPARPMSVAALAGRWIDASGNVYAFDPTGGFTFGLGDSPGLGGAFGVEGLALVLTFSDGDVSRRTLFVTGEGDPAGMISVDGEVFVSIE